MHGQKQDAVTSATSLKRRREEKHWTRRLTECSRLESLNPCLHITLSRLESPISFVCFGFLLPRLDQLNHLVVVQILKALTTL